MDGETGSREPQPSSAPSTFRGPLAAVLPDDWTDLLAAPDASLPLSPATNRDVWDHVDAGVRRAITATALAEQRTPWPQPLASQAARVHRDGDRVAWEDPAFARHQRITRAAVMAATTGAAEWIDAVADGIVLVCEQSSWCWPAHDDTFERHGAVLATVTDPYLDLGAGEAVAQLAWIDQLLGAALDDRYPGLRTRIRVEARRRVFTPFTARRDWHWIGLDGDVHNWNPWIHGNVLVAALRLLDAPTERDERAHIAALAVEGLDRYVAALPSDGAIDEGYEYWWNGACRALEAIEVLTFATGGRVSPVAKVPALRATVAFPHRMHLGGGWYLNLADGQAHPVEPKNWHALYRAAVIADDDDARAHAVAQRLSGAPLATEHAGAGRLLRAMSDPQWLDPEWLAAEPASVPLPGSVWLPSVQVLLVREHADTAAGLTVAVKGGHNGEHHNHNDVGSIVVASDGVPVIVDPGRPTYTKQTFGPHRYDIWTMQSHWHSVPLWDGRPQSAGAVFSARDVRVDPDAGELSLDFAAAYEGGEHATLTRAVRLDRAAGRVQLTDRADRPLVERFVVAGDVHLDGDGARIVPLGGATPLRLRWSPGLTARVEHRELDDPMLTSVWGARLARIEIDVAAGDAFDLTVERDEVIAEDHA
ncbi:heparinase II/III domain-containing protein [Microbacterium telephonicum]|uniref:Heparinase II/III-like protein n=1 Tax=Microbacterium telephonicum TaxID=1714841 RepID=A0A498CB34_9MICO|nr:heparinase II/III family protein [Microbacterium telephonicum]RLK52693.1 heparinase II/III-like protein [Microbacterium telephonicum]